ncbi:glycoside hydrolase family 3 N-terminal domain-containing protein [soil metagenome]
MTTSAFAVRSGLPAAMLATFVVGLSLSCAAPAPTGVSTGPLPIDDERWVQQTLSKMSLEERIGQMLMLQLSGGFENFRGQSMLELERVMESARIGGLFVGLGSALDVAVKLNELQSRSALPLLIAAEMEWGSALDLWRTTQLPHSGQVQWGAALPFNMGIAATRDPHQAELAGRITAAEARAVGVHWLFAPVVDINTAPANPMINIRSYGSNPALVAAFAAAFIRGAATGGVLTTAKHFPGHGDTRVDSHVALPVINVDVDVLHSREMVPFRAAIEAGVSAVMLGHVAVPALTGGFTNPATLSPQIGVDLLRGELGFDGLIVTDAMTKGALRHVAGYSPGELVVRAVEAGADVVLDPPDALLAHRALVTAVRSGRIHYTRVDSSVVRVLRAKARIGLHVERTVPLDSVPRIVGAPEHEIIARSIAERSLTLARDSARIMPLDPRRIRDLTVVAFSTPADVGAGAEFAAELERIYGRGVSFFRIDEKTAESVHDSAVARAKRSDATILATFSMPAPGQTLITPEAARRIARRLQVDSRNMLVISFGEPYGPATLPGASTYLLAWQPLGTAAQQAAARAIAGRLPLPGTPPVRLPRHTDEPGLARSVFDYGLEFARPEEVGMDPDRLGRVDSIISAHLIRGAAPGAALAVGRNGRLVRLRGYGTLDRRRGFAEVTDSSLYDVASLTKVMATTTAIMMLYDDGLIRLDDPVMQHLPEWRGTPEKEAVTIRNLLLHNSGLPGYAAFYRELQGREQYRRRITGMSLAYTPASRTLYSDLGVILLAFIVEQVSGRPLDAFMRSRFFAPLGMRDTGFNPMRWPYGTLQQDTDTDPGGSASDPFIARIAPTEVDTTFRHRHLRGEVHDENAFALGGVAGHAGLFSTARDMAIFAQLMLNRGFFGGHRFIDPATVDMFTRRDGDSSRALGWDTPDGVSSAGSLFSPSSFGHTGFTGTSIWIDPERDLFVVLLTNRVNPTRDNQRHVPLRREVADAVQAAITGPSASGPLR